MGEKRIGLTNKHYRHYCAFCRRRIPEKNQEPDSYWDWHIIKMHCSHCGNTTINDFTVTVQDANNNELTKEFNLMPLLAPSSDKFYMKTRTLILTRLRNPFFFFKNH